MNRRLFLLAVGVALLPIFKGALAHTPYRQWKIMRQRFLLVHSSRADSMSDELAEKLVAILQDVLPEARAMVARARDEQRVASLLTTGQAMLAVMHADRARDLYHQQADFSPYEGSGLRTLVAVGDYRLVTVDAFPRHHGWLVTSALVEYGADAGVRLMEPVAGEDDVPVHDGAMAFGRGEPLESQK